MSSNGMMSDEISNELKEEDEIFDTENYSFSLMLGHKISSEDEFEIPSFHLH